MKLVAERKLSSTEICSVAHFYNPKIHLPKSWPNAIDTWLRIVHSVERKKRPSDTGLNRGEEAEPLLLQCYRENVGPAWRPELTEGQRWIVQHPTESWFTASPDAFYSPPPTRGIIEFKSCSRWGESQFGTPGTDQIPERTLMQVAWAMACCEASEALVLVGFVVDSKDENGRRATIYERTVPYHVERELQLEASLFEYGHRFINDFVVTRKAPPGEPRYSKRAWKRIVNGSDAEVERSTGEGSESPQADSERPRGPVGESEVQVR